MSERADNLLAALATGLADEQRRATAAATGLTESGVAAVIALAQFLDGARIADLADVLGLSHSGAVRLVTQLAEASAVRRVPLGDGREVGVRLTARGRELAEHAAEARAATVEAVMHELTAREREELERVLDALVAAHARARRRRREQGQDVVRAWLCRTCDLAACGRADGRCPAARAAAAGESTR